MRRALAAVLPLAITSVGLVGATAAAAPAAPPAAPAKQRACPETPFTGTISRTKDDFSSQPAAKRDGADMTDALVYDSGTGKSYTVYVGDHELDPDELGSTLVAPEGNVLVTIFLAAKNTKPLRRGQRLKVDRDLLTVIVDAGGVAQASSEEQEGFARITKLSDRRVCFRIDYQDSHQRVDGSVSASIP